MKSKLLLLRDKKKKCLYVLASQPWVWGAVFLLPALSAKFTKE